MDDISEIRRMIRLLEMERDKLAERIAVLRGQLERIESPVNYICKKGDNDQSK